GRPNEILQRGAELKNATCTSATALPGGHVEGVADSMTSHFREIYRAILAGAAPADPLFATFEAGHNEMTVGDAVARSAAEERWVDVAD
ncbi:MAG TPA: gfo/Idh/MocA family oxidoreductase, partial [Anaerolineae bacterium]|nr:gfo/Idh/MocA family oxidoreductase [Anaerolineae bacterium]